MKFFTALATAAILVTGVTVASPAQAGSCDGLTGEAEKACWKQVFQNAGEYITKEDAAANLDKIGANESDCWTSKATGYEVCDSPANPAATNSDGCPAGQAMTRVSGEKVGCMTPAQYKLYEAQMRAAYRRPAPVGGYVPNNSYQIRALQQQNLYNQHQQFRIRNGY